MTILQLFAVYNWSTVGVDAVLVVLYSACLFTIQKASQDQFAILICALMIGSNICGTLVVWSNIGVEKTGLATDDGAFYFWLILQAFAGFFRDACFNYGHWLFSWTYICTSLQMPYLFAQQELTESFKRNKLIAFWVGVAVNIFVIFMYCFAIYRDNVDAHNGGTMSKAQEAWFLTWKYSVGFCQLVSGIVLLVAICIIRNFLIKNGLGDEVNHTSMILHAVSFSLYLLSIFFFYYYYYVFLEAQETDTVTQSTRSALIAWIITTYMNFLAQLFLIVILYQLG